MNTLWIPTFIPMRVVPELVRHKIGFSHVVSFKVKGNLIQIDYERSPEYSSILL